MIEIRSENLLARINEDIRGDVPELVFQGRNLLSKNGLSCWIKKDSEPDHASGVFKAFHPDFQLNPGMTLKESSACEAVLEKKAGALTLTRKYTLSENSLKIESTIKNTGNGPSITLQFENFNTFLMPPPEIREREWTKVETGGKTGWVHLEGFGQRKVYWFPGSSCSMEFGHADANFHLRMESEKCEGMAQLLVGSTLMRGVNSEKFTLGPGEQFTHNITLSVYESAIKVPENMKNRKHGKVSFDKYLAGQPVFSGRWSHLCLQYDKVDPETLKKLIGDFLTPLRYTGIILELNRGIRTTSHPELGEDWALSVKQIREIMDFARSLGLKAGIEYNTPGHQNETMIPKKYPGLIEPDPEGRPTSALCLTNPAARRLMDDIFKELAETLRPDVMHLGADEIQFINSASGTIGNCPECRKQEAAKLLADWITHSYNLFAGYKIPCWVWSDMFLTEGAGGASNGARGDVYRAADMIPKELSVTMWSYFPQDNHPLSYFSDKGFRDVIPTSAFSLKGIRSLLAQAEKEGLKTALHTTWSAPDRGKFAIESAIWGGIIQWAGGGMSVPDSELESYALSLARQFWNGN